MKIKNAIMLLLTATIWGTAFVAQAVGMDYIGPFTFGAVRMFLGGVVLIPVVLIFCRNSFHTPTITSEELSKKRKTQLIGGIICGAILFSASALQQIGILYTTPGKAGFITALYIILVPILGIFFKQNCSKIVWIGVFLSVIGFYFLCIKDGFTLQKGDFIVLVCSILFSFHIIAVDHYSPITDGVILSCIQFFTASILNTIFMLIFEEPHLHNIMDAKLPILYTGILSCGIAYTFQILGQKGVNPTIASLIMSLESVISAIASAIILKDYLTPREMLGCAIIFSAIILVQIPWKKPKKKHQ